MLTAISIAEFFIVRAWGAAVTSALDIISAYW
jgi:hypothetical protein